ncbi:MAG TPA: asparagine--tRNA ligase [Spirochaetota bacterium]|nr:asparagine--tRNA ligase [Spirochaetota bacterium]HPJ37898.1 asparagine--tRNA ligase [Spirochaetota bacterium]HPQ52987.1 asparagine--tRNA ligase [Spirochaetota bacterium]
MMNRKLIKEILKNDSANYDTIIKGWVRTKREAKNFSFLEINDGSTIGNIQVVADESIPGYKNVLEASTGSSVTIEGKVVDSPGKGQRYEIQALNVTLHGNADPETYPLQKKRHSFEFLREIAHLRPRTNTFGAVMRLRNALSFAIHSFFQEKNFLYVHTPIITASDCEGAGEMFRVTTLDLTDLPKNNGSIDYSEDFFGKKTGLTVSGQLEGELIATALGNIYTFGPTFRAENSNTARHLAEFWMVEPEMAFAELPDDMKLAEEFLKYIFRYCLEKCPEDMEFFDARIKPDTISMLEGIINSSFEILTYTEAIDILKKSGESFEFPVEWGSDMQSEHERFLTEKHLKKPVIVIDYPASIKAFYMKLNDDEKTVRAMDVLVPRIGEIIGGSEREDRYDVLLARMNAANLNPEEYWWYLDTRRFGSVPHAGFGLGFERTVQFVTGMQNIRDVIPFPRTPKNAEF